MKSERRHELQTNVLGQFINRYANALSWGALGVAVVLLAAALWYRHSTKQEEQYQTEFSRLILLPQTDMKPEERIDNLKDLLNRDDNDARKAAVAYELGKEYSTRMLIAPDVDKKSIAEQARKYYGEVISKYGKQSLIVAKAHLGLAKLAENDGDFEAAKAQYQAAMDLTSVSDYPVAQLAKEARDAMEQYRQPVEFATTAPSTQPTTSSKPTTASKPASASAPAKPAAAK